MDVQIACVCEGAPHPNDTVTLRERLDFRTVRTMRNEIRLLKSRDEEASTAEILATLTETYLLMGIESWSVRDAKSKALPVSRATITERLFGNPEQAEIVGDAADELYGAIVLLPLVAAASSSSAPTPTNGSTSPKSTHPRRPRPSRPSLTSITPTAATETTSSSLDGVSNSSQNSVSAA